MSEIRILKPSVDDYDGSAVIRGVIDPTTLENLLIDSYQRELLPSRSRREIKAALQNKERLPDIMLGMRGDTFEMDNGVLVLTDPVFIVDGRQRRDTVLEFMRDTCGSENVRLGAIVHVNTTLESERELFHKLNQYQVKVSPNVLLRNLKDDHPGIATLYGLTHNDKNGVLYNRTTWSQNALRGELISANSLMSIALRLHRHHTAQHRGLTINLPLVDKLVEKIGLPVFRSNVKTYFDLVDECWGIKRVTIKGGAPYMRRAFLEILAMVISDHPIFWKQPDDRRIEINALLKKAVRKIPVDDPEIIRLSGASGAARVTLYHQMIAAINSGKRTHRLVSRRPTIMIETEDDEDEAQIA